MADGKLSIGCDSRSAICCNIQATGAPTMQPSFAPRAATIKDISSPMPLTLRILSYRNEAPTEPITRQFGPNGGMIGRAPGNDLELPDPGKYVSRSHAQIAYRDTEYYLTDVGSNPTLINDRPLGTGHVARLSHGDLLTMGDYVLQVTIIPDAAPPPSPLVHPFAPPTEVAPVSQPANTLVDPLAAASVLGGGDLMTPTAGDPLGLNLFGGLPAQDPLAISPVTAAPGFRGSESDHVPPQMQPFQVPASGIPVDYDPLADHGWVPVAPIPAPQPPVAPVMAPVPSPPIPTRAVWAAPIPPAAPIPAPALDPALADSEPTLLPSPTPIAMPSKPVPLPVATPASVSSPPVTISPVPTAVASDSEVFAALLRGLGMPTLRHGSRSEVEVAELVGQMLRESVSGAMLVLRARNAIKREIRSEMTMIAVRDNNPLKFLPDADSVLTQMLTNTLTGYLPPVQAISGAFDDLKAHELAVMTGVRAVMADMLNQLNPAAIEAADNEAGMMDKVMPANRKARLWDKLTTQHAEMRRLLDDDFQKLFGDKFTAAYEEQLARLRQRS
ncbi:type VI secretion system-associated FHA domain protein TagH [Chitinivorax sp. B]|uniref:type VI secretion system-associated FHA domain protein TagH n=1 Tax=Chitinivorax sp. B TaxID=2502235 RepID=UPI0010F485C7|nr:type VI secretion system-associated FHA domain protein TagH [Chitinivorax sp. B]